MFNLFKGDPFRTFLVVEGHEDIVIVYDHTINKAINQPSASFQGIGVHFAELENVELNLLSGELRFFHLFLNDAQLQLFFGGFQLVQTALGRGIENACLDCVEHIVDCFLRISQLPPQSG